LSTFHAFFGLGDTCMSSRSLASAFPELCMVYAFRELVIELRTRFMACDIGFSPDLWGVDVLGEEFAEERCFRRSGLREGSETTMIAVHISAMLHTSKLHISENFNERFGLIRTKWNKGILKQCHAPSNADGNCDQAKTEGNAKSNDLACRQREGG
jgi:hypothetical protein